MKETFVWEGNGAVAHHQLVRWKETGGRPRIAIHPQG